MFTSIFLAVLSGVFLGTCFLPMRYMKRFAWENTWFVWVFCGCVVFPPLIAWLTIPSLVEVMREVGLRLNLIILGVGLIAGASGVLFGRALAMIGMALANSLSNGVSLAVGSFVPLAVQHRDALRGQIGMFVIPGLALAIAGVVIMSFAASQRKEESAYSQIDYQGGRRMRIVALQGIVLAIAAGLLTPLQNLGIAFADDFMKVARSHGASEVFMTFAFYIPYLGASFVSNGVYCATLWKRNHTLKQFREPGAGRYTAMAFGMAVVWMAGMLFYGWAMPWMKTYGPVIGWPVSLATANLAATAVEYFYGDWKGPALRTLGYGLVALTLSILTFAWSNLIIQKMLP